MIFWDQYKGGGVYGSCHYNKPAFYNGYNWDQKAEKLARTSLMFSDKTSIQSAGSGIKVKFETDGAWENLWDSDIHDLTIPWTLDSGFWTGDDDTWRWLHFHFGQTNPTVLVWGLQLMKEQVSARGTISLSLAYKYLPDETSGAHSGTWRKPYGTEDGHETYSISASDLDDNGLYYFKLPSPNQEKNMMFVATHIFVRTSSGYLNFDFLGTFYDFNVAKSGKKSGIDDNFNERGISNFWIKGDDMTRDCYNCEVCTV